MRNPIVVQRSEKIHLDKFAETLKRGKEEIISFKFLFILNLFQL